MRRLQLFIVIAVITLAGCSDKTEATKSISLQEAIEISQAHLSDLGYQVADADIYAIEDLSGENVLGLDPNPWNLMTYADGKELHISVDRQTGDVTRTAIRR